MTDECTINTNEPNTLGGEEGCGHCNKNEAQNHKGLYLLRT